MFWHGGSGKKKCFGVARAARKVFWRGGSGKTSVLAWRERQEKCFGVAGVARKVFWRGGSDYSAPFSSYKIRANLRGFYKRQSQLTGGQVLGPTIFPPAGARVPVMTST